MVNSFFFCAALMLKMFYSVFLGLLVTTVAVQGSLSGFCNGRSNGNYPDPNSNHRFIMCSSGIVYVFNCPAQLCFNASSNQCDYCSARPDATGFCQNRTDGNYANPLSRSSFISCTNRHGIVRQCQMGLCYDEAKDKCLYQCTSTTSTPAYTVTRPSTKGSPRPSTKGSPRPSTKARPTVPPGFCGGKANGNYPDPKCKHRFIMCSAERGYFFYCPAKLCFKASANRCDFCPPKRDTPDLKKKKKGETMDKFADELADKLESFDIENALFDNENEV